MATEVVPALLNAADAEEYTEALAQVFAGGMRLAGLAEDLGVPAALGLSEEEWLSRRLAGQIKLSIPERRRVVAELTANGKSAHDIGEALGVSEKTVDRDRAANDAGTDVPEAAQPEPEPEPDLPDDAGTDVPAKPDPEDRRLGFLMSSASDGWETPQALFDVLNDEYGFTLDVCALDCSAKCERYFTPEQDGLAQEWEGVCWMNPPYGDEIGRWVAKARESAGRGATVVCLLPARTDTAWWWEHCWQGDVMFLRGRLKFGAAQNSAPFPSAVVVFGPTRGTFVGPWEWR